MGVCQHVVTEKMRCAIEESDCAPTHIEGEKQFNGEKWFNSYNLLKDKKIELEDVCRCDENTLVGSCVTLNDSGMPVGYRCAPHRRACDHQGNETYVHDSVLPDGTKCTCSHVILPGLTEPDDDSMTQWGLCATRKSAHSDKYYAKGSFCAVSRADCGDPTVTNTRYLSAAQAEEILGYPCTCDLVQVGGCRGDTGGHCAVTEDSCVDGTRFGGTHYSPPEFMYKYNMKCRLCPPNANTYKHFQDQNRLNEAAAPQVSVSSLENPVIIGLGATIGVLALCFIALSIVYHKVVDSKVAKKGGVPELESPCVDSVITDDSDFKSKSDAFKPADVVEDFVEDKVTNID